MSIREKILKWLYFNVKNPVVRKGESGGFNWTFRRFWLEISTKSGNFKARFTAAEHPYSYLISGKDDKNIIGFCNLLYTVGMLLTTEQKFADSIEKAISSYDKRIQKENPVVEDETEEKIALETEKQIQEVVEKLAKDRRNYEKQVNRKFKKAVKKAEKEEV